MTNIFHLQISDFATQQGQELIKPELKNEVVLLFFKADWCHYCRVFFPDFLEVARILPYVKFGIVDVDQQRDLIEKINNTPNSMYNVKSFPTLVVYKNGEFYESVLDRSVPTLTAQLNRAYFRRT